MEKSNRLLRIKNLTTKSTKEAVCLPSLISLVVPFLSYLRQFTCVTCMNVTRYYVGLFLFPYRNIRLCGWGIRSTHPTVSNVASRQTWIIIIRGSNPSWPVTLKAVLGHHLVPYTLMRELFPENKAEEYTHVFMFDKIHFPSCAIQVAL